MPSRLVQRIRWIRQFSAPAELARQLAELERGFYNALGAASDGISSLLSGLDGVDIVGSTVRSSRDVKVFAAGGNNLGGIATKDILRFELTAHATVTGFIAPGANDTHRKLVVNASAYTLTFTHNATSAVTNRLMCPHLVAFELRPSECTWIDYDRTTQRWRVTDQSQPFYAVRAVADLPTAVAGVITLTAGLWAFYGAINVGSNRVVQPAGAFVWCPEITSYLGANTASAALTVSNHINAYQMQVVNFGAGLSVEATGASGLTQEFHNWYVNFGNKNQHIAAQDVLIRRGLWGAITWEPEFPGRAYLEQFPCSGFSVDASTDSLISITAQDVTQTDEGLGTRVINVPDGVKISGGVYMLRCVGNDNGLLTLGADINDSGNYPHVTVQDCNAGSNSSGDIHFDVVPGGGALITGNKLWTTPYNGFDHLTAGVFCLGNRTVFGSVLANTPNGHIVKNNAGTDQTQRHYLKYAYPLATSDDGTSIVVGLGEEETITFADDGSGGTLGAALFDVSGLPDNCVALVRVAASWGASSGTAAEIDNLDGAGVAYAVISCNGGTLVHVQTEPFNGSADTQFHIMTLVSDTPSEPAIFLGIDSGQLQLSVALSGLTYASPFLSGSGTLIVENIWERGLQS